jgi:hypothetical protein
VEQRDESILLDGSKLFLIVANILFNMENTYFFKLILKRVRLAIHEGIPQKLHALKSLSEQERLLKITDIALALRDDYGLEIETAYEIVDYFGEALGYKPIGTPKPAAPVTIISFGGYDWRVLETQNNKALILSEKILERSKYYTRDDNVTWAGQGCIPRNILNGEFYNKFSANDKARIIETRVTTNNNPWYGTKGGDASNDKIFLLSIDEVLQYFGDSGALNSLCYSQISNGCTINDQYNTARLAYYNCGGNMVTKPTLTFNFGASSWWLRTPASRGCSAVSVDNDGELHLFSSSGVAEIGLRPALWLNL